MITIKKELEGKRLLVLGGRLWADSIKNFCVENRITIITAGNNPHSKLNFIADEYYEVNSTDYEAMKCLIISRKIDGVYLGGNESVISVATRYVNDLGLPCYCTPAQWGSLQNKAEFKELCLLFDLPVLPRYNYAELLDAEDDTIYPIIVKPVDSSGSYGFSMCRNRDELVKGYKRACEVSSSDEALVEKYIKNDSVVVFYTFSQGKAYFSGIEDKYPVKYCEQGSFVAGMHLFESDLSDIFRNKFENKLLRLFHSLSIQEGTLWMEVFYDAGNFYFNEAGFRYSGSVSPYPIDYFYGINQIAADIYFALTNKSKIFGHKSLCNELLERKAKYAIYSVHIKPGIICKEKGFDFICGLKNIVNVSITMNIGDEVKASGSIGQVYAFVHFTYDENNELVDMLNLIQDKLIVIDQKGNNMVNKMIDTKTLIIR